jgi:hypothetical protein
MLIRKVGTPNTSRATDVREVDKNGKLIPESMLDNRPGNLGTAQMILGRFVKRLKSYHSETVPILYSLPTEWCGTSYQCKQVWKVSGRRLWKSGQTKSS